MLFRVPLLAQISPFHGAFVVLAPLLDPADALLRLILAIQELEYSQLLIVVSDVVFHAHGLYLAQRAETPSGDPLD